MTKFNENNSSENSSNNPTEDILRSVATLIGQLTSQTRQSSFDNFNTASSGSNPSGTSESTSANHQNHYHPLQLNPAVSNIIGTAASLLNTLLTQPPIPQNSHFQAGTQGNGNSKREECVGKGAESEKNVELNGKFTDQEGKAANCVEKVVDTKDEMKNAVDELLNEVKDVKSNEAESGVKGTTKADVELGVKETLRSDNIQERLTNLNAKGVYVCRSGNMPKRPLTAADVVRGAHTRTNNNLNKEDIFSNADAEKTTTETFDNKVAKLPIRPGGILSYVKADNTNSFETCAGKYLRLNWQVTSPSLNHWPPQPKLLLTNVYSSLGQAISVGLISGDKNNQELIPDIHCGTSATVSDLLTMKDISVDVFIPEDVEPGEYSLTFMLAEQTQKGLNLFSGPLDAQVNVQPTQSQDKYCELAEADDFEVVDAKKSKAERGVLNSSCSSDSDSESDTSSDSDASGYKAHKKNKSSLKVESSRPLAVAYEVGEAEIKKQRKLAEKVLNRLCRREKRLARKKQRLTKKLNKIESKLNHVRAEKDEALAKRNIF